MGSAIFVCSAVTETGSEGSSASAVFGSSAQASSRRSYASAANARSATTSYACSEGRDAAAEVAGGAAMTAPGLAGSVAIENGSSPSLPACSPLIPPWMSCEGPGWGGTM